MFGFVTISLKFNFPIQRALFIRKAFFCFTNLGIEIHSNNTITSDFFLTTSSEFLNKKQIKKLLIDIKKNVNKFILNHLEY